MFLMLYKVTIVPVNHWYYGLHSTYDPQWGAVGIGSTDGFYGTQAEVIAWQKKYGNRGLHIEAIRAFTEASEANRELLKLQDPISLKGRQKLSEINMGDKNPFYGEQHTAETIKVLSEHRRGIKWCNNGQIEKQIPKDSDVPNGWKAGRLARKLQGKSRAKP